MVFLFLYSKGIQSVISIKVLSSIFKVTVVIGITGLIILLVLDSDTVINITNFATKHMSNINLSLDP
ncbi:hypothetical protein C9J21_19990 [Photobacterium phosphoreum]|nr:hypothetical protein C9J21_19990 [Photobacterium phosphoreum]